MTVPLVPWLVSIALAGACSPVCTPAQPAIDDDPLGEATPELPTPEPTHPRAPSPAPVDGEVTDTAPSIDASRVQAAVDQLVATHLAGPSKRAVETVPPTPRDPSLPGAPAPDFTVASPNAPDPAPTEPISHPHRESPSTTQVQAQPHAQASTTTVQGHPATDSPTRQVLALLAGALAVGLYHKLSKDKALDHPARARILEILEAEPGTGTTQIAESLDVCYRTALHHLEVLQRFDLVVQATDRGRARWALPDDTSTLRTPEFSDSEATILELLEDDPGLHLSEIARRSELSKSTVKTSLDRLAENGVVADERVGPLRRFFPTDEAPTPSQGA